jgi:hypothetical protein
MPHFVLNIEGDPNPVRIDLPSVNAAKCEALRYASKTVCDNPEQFWSTRDFQMTVTDGSGLALFALTISGIEAPAIRAEPRIPA